jgi:hypothetical protein
MTNRDRVLAVLQARAGEWISGVDFVAAGGGYRYGGRVHELRQAGYVIEERRDPTGRTAVGQYRLVVDPVQLAAFGETAA